MQTVTSSSRTARRLAAAGLRVADAMHRGVLTCSRNAPLSQVAEQTAGATAATSALTISSGETL